MDRLALNQQRLAPLFPELIRRGKLFIADCEQAGVNILITQGLRTWEEQDWLYAQGRTAPGKIVTNAKGGQSYHNFGLAFDIVPIDENGVPIWDTTREEWDIAETVGNGHLHEGSAGTRLSPEIIAQVVDQDLGFTWGGDFHSIKDIPHFELTGGVTLQVLRNLYKPGDLSACWREVETRI